MRLFHRKRRFPQLPAPPNELTLALNRWIDATKRRLADALSRCEQRLSIRQKKWTLALFCALSASLFLFNLYRGLIHHPSNAYQPAEYIHMPAELPLPVPPVKNVPPSLRDTAGRLIPYDSTTKNPPHATTRQ